MRYEGEFRDSMMHGQGKIFHTDTGNIFEGNFYLHRKDGPATFTLKSGGEQFKGHFELNIESSKGADYGPRT
jgi:hypothetical protein